MQQPSAVVEEPGPRLAAGGAVAGGDGARGLATPRGRRRLGLAQVADRDDARAGVGGEQLQVVLLQHRRRRVEGVGLLAGGAEERPDVEGVGPALQVGTQLGAGLVAVGRVLGHQLADDGGERGGDPLGDLLDRLGVVHPLLVDLVDRVAPLERRRAGEGEVERAPQAVEVAAGVGLGGVAELLRAGVVERPQQGVGPGQAPFLAERLGQPQVEDLGVPLGGDHDVRRLDVAVDQPRGVRGLQAAEDPQEQPRGRRHPQRAVPLVLDQVEQAQAGDVFQDHEVDVAVLAEGQRAGDVGVVAARGQLHLALEPGEAVGLLLGAARGEDLDGDLAGVPLVGGEVDLAHAPLAELAEDAVATEEEAAGRAGEELAGLILRQQPALDHPAGEADGVLAGAGGAEGRQLGRGDQARAAHAFQELVQPDHRPTFIALGIRGSPPVSAILLVGDDVDDQAGDVVLGVVRERQVLEQDGGLLGVGDGAQHAADLGVGDDAGEAVAGHEEAVAAADVHDAEVLRPAAGVLAAEVEVQDVLELVVVQLLGRDGAGVEQGAGQVVVLGQALQHAVAKAVGARVPQAGDVDLVREELGEDDGRPHVRELGDRAGAAEDLLVDLGDGLADRLLDVAGLGVVGGEPLGDLAGDQLDGHEAGLLAPLLAPHAVGHDEQVGGLQRHGRGLAALGQDVIPDGTAAGDVVVVLVVLAIVAAHRDDAHLEAQAARVEGQRGEGGELVGGLRVVAGSAAERAPPPSLEAG